MLYSGSGSFYSAPWSDSVGGWLRVMEQPKLLFKHADETQKTPIWSKCEMPVFLYIMQKKKKIKKPNNSNNLLFSVEKWFWKQEQGMTMKGWGSKVTVTGLLSFEIVQGPEGKSMSKYD